MTVLTGNLVSSKKMVKLEDLKMQLKIKEEKTMKTLKKTKLDPKHVYYPILASPRQAKLRTIEHVDMSRIGRGVTSALVGELLVSNTVLALVEGACVCSPSTICSWTNPEKLSIVRS